jgi:hypothetical protein
MKIILIIIRIMGKLLDKRLRKTPRPRQYTPCVQLTIDDAAARGDLELFNQLAKQNGSRFTNNYKNVHKIGLMTLLAAAENGNLKIIKSIFENDLLTDKSNLKGKIRMAIEAAQDSNHPYTASYLQSQL